MNRRTLLAGAVTAGTAATAGCLGLFEDGPDDVAEEFIEHVDDGELAAANELIHEQSTIDGAGQAADLLAAFVGADDTLDALDLSVEETTVVAESDTEARVQLLISVDLILEEVEQAVDVELRDEDGEWRVWAIG